MNCPRPRHGQFLNVAGQATKSRLTAGLASRAGSSLKQLTVLDCRGCRQKLLPPRHRRAQSFSGIAIRFTFFAELDDQDLFADVTEHDGMTWLNDVFELFLKPAADKPGYYEFQVNSANTRMDMFVPRRESYSYFRFKSKRPFHFESAVTVNGTLDDRTDVDRGWTVEGQIPWRDFIDTGGRPAVKEVWRFAICRYDYTQQGGNRNCRPARLCPKRTFTSMKTTQTCSS